MATDHKSSNVLSEPTERSPIENELPAYRAISSRAVLSVLCGILAVFSIASPFFYIFAVLAVVLGFTADWNIQRYPDILTGRGLAQTGAALGLIFGLGIFTVSSVQGYIHARNAENPGFEEVLGAVLKATWLAPHAKGYNGEIANTVDEVVLYDLMALSANDHASDAVRAIASLKLHELDNWLGAPAEGMDKAHAYFASRQIALFEKDPKRIDLTAPVEPPDGPPIGSMGTLDCDWQP